MLVGHLSECAGRNRCNEDQGATYARYEALHITSIGNIEPALCPEKSGQFTPWLPAALRTLGRHRWCANCAFPCTGGNWQSYSGTRDSGRESPRSGA
jgi:hypothetical protein